MRIVERTKQINQDNILLELYMKRMMHPDRISQLLIDTGSNNADGIELDAIICKYVESV